MGVGWGNFCAESLDWLAGNGKNGCILRAEWGVLNCLLLGCPLKSVPRGTLF